MFSDHVLSDLLYENGASLVGFADLSELVDDDLMYGVSIAVCIPPEIVRQIHDGPTREYFDTYHALNDKLNRLAEQGAAYIADHNYRAFAQTTNAVHEYDIYRTKMPHKTVAVAAGLGWIGKSALFVTLEYGSALRLTSIRTNAPLTTGTRTTRSECGDCRLCKQACPGNAISGRLWTPDLDRDYFFNPFACRNKARELSADRIQQAITLCGKCIEVCPYTQTYLLASK